MKVRIVEVSSRDKTGGTKRYYKLQTSWFGWIWSDETEPQYGMLYPTFDTYEDAENYVLRTYFETERIVKIFDTKNKKL